LASINTTNLIAKDLNVHPMDLLLHIGTLPCFSPFIALTSLRVAYSDLVSWLQAISLTP
jgi:hypothetical protein